MQKKDEFSLNFQWISLLFFNLFIKQIYLFKVPLGKKIMDKMSTIKTNNYLTFMFECAACDALKNVQPSVF